MKIKSITIIIMLNALVLVIFIATNILLYNFTFLYLINIFLILLDVLTNIFIINFLYYTPFKKIIRLLKHYNDDNFSYQIYELNSKEIKEINTEITTLGTKLKQLKQNNIELLNENNSYYNQYQKDLENKKQLVATISHEIKTPLTVIEATASGIIDEIFPKEEINDELNNIIKECDKTTKMLQEIVNIYKLDNNKINLDSSKIDVLNLIKEIIEFNHSLILKYEKEIILLTNTSFKYTINLNQFKRVLNNVLINAITYSPKGEKITINIIDNLTYKVLEIINYGINIPKNDIKKVFEPFYQVDKSRTKKQDYGNGLGLYIVKEILEKHHLDYGILNVNNGVKFYIIFPNEAPY